MMPLFDMLNNADNGKAMDLMARQYGLSQEQVQLATEALLPAFSQGLKRNAGDPSGLGGFIQAMASGNHAQYFDNPSQALGPDGQTEGNGILGHLFGSKDVSRAVAAHAAQSTGIAQSILQKMLPVLASMIMGGLFKQSTGQMPGQSGGGNVIGSIIEQMMRGGMGGGASSGAGTNPGSGFDPFNNPLGQAMKDMMTGGRGQAQESAPQAPQSNNPLGGTPWGKILEGMMGGGMMGGSTGNQAQQPAPQPEPANPSGRAANPYDDLFGNMFETGRKTGDDYQRGTEAIFDTFLKGMDKRS